jgi:hypothetical protein
MCQLTFINTNDKDFNKSVLVNQYLVNTVNTHKDGWGFFTPESEVFKTHLDPWFTKDLGRVISDRIRTNDPIIGHVRLATITNKEKKVCKENSHPFMTKDFVVAHNGSFAGEILEEERFKGKIDSEIFTILLQEAYDKFPKMSLPKLLKEAYDQVTGKFAFLIYFIPQKRYYISRGRTADLHMMDIFLETENEKKKFKKRKIGYIINTDKSDLVRGFKLATKTIQLYSDKIFLAGEPEELSENTIFIANTTHVRDVGKLVEKFKVTTTTTSTVYDEDYYANTDRYHNRRGLHHRNRTHVVTKTPREEHVDFLMGLFDDSALSTHEINHLFLEITGYSIISAKSEQFDLFEDVLGELLKANSNHKRDLWRKLIQHVPNPIGAYDLYGVQFPYFLNS